jgi:lipoate-protein ligase A
MKTNPGILSADYKVIGGKLLRVRISLENREACQYISSISITGDFFMHPEQAIEGLERALTGIAYQQNEVEIAVTAFFETGVEIIGADPADFIHVILSAS